MFVDYDTGTVIPGWPKDNKRYRVEILAPSWFNGGDEKCMNTLSCPIPPDKVDDKEYINFVIKDCCVFNWGDGELTENDSGAYTFAATETDPKLWPCNVRKAKRNKDNQTASVQV